MAALGDISAGTPVKDGAPAGAASDGCRLREPRPEAAGWAYNAYAGEKRMAIYPYNDHEGGGAFHQVEQMTWLRSLL